MEKEAVLNGEPPFYVTKVAADQGRNAKASATGTILPANPKMDKSSTVFPKYRILFYSWFRDSREPQLLARLGLGVYLSVSALRRK
jgi:hypothetical protein